MIYDVDKNQKQILDSVGSVFAKETLNLQREKFKVFKTDINDIIINLEKWSNMSGKDKEYYLKAAYVKIMEFRSEILGINNKIQYRLYIRSDGNNLSDVQIVNVNEEQLMSVVNRDRTSLRLKQNLDAVKQEQFNDFRRQRIFNTHMKNIEKGLEHPKRSPKNYVVTQEVIAKYAKEHKIGPNGQLLAIGLHNLAFQDDTVKGKSAYTLKLFNKGWIYQAFDETVETLDRKKNGLSESVSLDEFHKEYFTESLNYDNVVGFKGGDVGLAQIKANMASLMSKTTLLKYLKIINNILNFKTSENGNIATNQELKEYIISNFINTKTDIISNNLNKIIDIEIEEVLKNLTK